MFFGNPDWLGLTDDLLVFESVAAATEFLQNPEFNRHRPTETYLYQTTFIDGTEFEKSVPTLEELTELHKNMTCLSEHMENLLSGN